MHCKCCPGKHGLHGKWKVIPIDAENPALFGEEANNTAQEGKMMPSGS